MSIIIIHIITCARCWKADKHNVLIDILQTVPFFFSCLGFCLKDAAEKEGTW